MGSRLTGSRHPYSPTLTPYPYSYSYSYSYSYTYSYTQLFPAARSADPASPLSPIRGVVASGSGGVGALDEGSGGEGAGLLEEEVDLTAELAGEFEGEN